MVARGRGRGGRGQAGKAKVAAAVEEPAPAEEVPEVTEAAAEGKNGTEEEQSEQTDEPMSEEQPADSDSQQTATQESADAPPEPEAKPEEKKEEKVEPGKLLVENLPSSFLFDYQDKLKELFSKHGDIISVKRGPIIVTELTTTPTLSAIVEFKNKDSLEKAMSEQGTLVEGRRLALGVESRADSAVLVGVPYEASTDYVKQLLGEAGQVAQVQEFSKTKYKILRVTFAEKQSVERALQLDRELRINGFLVTVSRYRDDDDQKTNQSKNKRQHQSQQHRNPGGGGGGGGGGGSTVNTSTGASPLQRNNNNFRGGGGGRGGIAYSPRGNFRGGRGRGGAAFPARGGGGFPRGGFAGGINNFMPPAPYMPRPQGFMNDGQRPNKRLRQM